MATTKTKTVVIAMDGSGHADKAFEWFMKNGYREGDKIVIAFCAEFSGIHSAPRTLMSNDPKLIVNMIEGEEDRVKKLAKRFEGMIKEYKTQGKIVRANGDPKEGILEVAKKEEAKMIVTGSRGMGTVRRTVLGSVSSYLVHHADVPVLVCNS